MSAMAAAKMWRGGRGPGARLLPGAFVRAPRGLGGPGGFVLRVCKPPALRARVMGCSVGTLPCGCSTAWDIFPRGS